MVRVRIMVRARLVVRFWVRVRLKCRVVRGRDWVKVTTCPLFVWMFYTEALPCTLALIKFEPYF